MVGMQPLPTAGNHGVGGKEQEQAEVTWPKGGRQTLLEAESPESVQREVTGCDRGASQ